MPRLYVFKQVHVRRNGSAWRAGSLVLVATALCFLWGIVEHSGGTPSYDQTQTYIPFGAPAYCVGDSPSPAAVGASEAQIDKNCPQDLTYHQTLYQLNEQYAAGDITTVPYPWCVAGQPCLPTADMTGGTAIGG